jgi:hypothetical protein
MTILKSFSWLLVSVQAQCSSSPPQNATDTFNLFELNGSPALLPISDAPASQFGWGGALAGLAVRLQLRAVSRLPATKSAAFS